MKKERNRNIFKGLKQLLGAVIYNQNQENFDLLRNF